MSNKESLLRFEFLGKPSFSVVRIYLDSHDQVIIGEGGAMIYMDGDIDLTTQSTGGLLKGISRALSKESIFQNIFKLKPEGNPPSSVTFGFSLPGDIEHLHLQPGDQWTLSKGAYVCSTEGVSISGKLGGFKSIIGGEGLFLTNVVAEAVSKTCLLE